MTAIPTPLIMLGSGGDYVARYVVRGSAIAKQVGQSLGQQPDTETAGGFAGYHRQRRGEQGFSDPSSVETTPRGVDAFELSDPAAGLGATYSPASLKARAASPSGPAAAAIPASAVASAAEAWLAAQHRALVAIPLFTAPPQTPPAPLAPGPARQHSITVPAATESPRPALQPTAYRTAIAAWPRIATAVALPVLNSWRKPAAPSSSSSSPSSNPEPDHEPHAQATSHPHPHPRPAAGAGLLADHAGAGRRAGRQQGDRLRARRGAHQKGGLAARSEQGTLFNG